jgi:hypothetical protein
MSGKVLGEQNLHQGEYRYHVSDIQNAITLLFLIGLKKIKMICILYNLLFPTVPRTLQCQKN